LRQRFEFKLAVFIFKALNGVSPQSFAASLPKPPDDDDFDRSTLPRVRFQELAQVWAIAHSLLLDCVRGTTYLSVYVILNLFFGSFAGY